MASGKKIGEVVTDIAFAFGFASRLALEHNIPLDNLTDMLRESYEQTCAAQALAQRQRDAKKSDVKISEKKEEKKR